MPQMPADYHDAFARAWFAFRAWREGAPAPVITIRGMPASIDRICGLLWRCSDVMPGSLSEAMSQFAPPGRPLQYFTYASGARQLRILYLSDLLARAERASRAAS